MGKYLEILNSKLSHTEKSDYPRRQYQSFMTTFEWRNVEMADELAKYMKEGGSLFHFPYFRQIYGLWRVTFKSFFVSRKYDSASSILNSEYGLMAAFIGIFTTLEYAPKGVISLFLRPFLNKKNSTPLQNHLAEYFQQYASDLQTIPFYDHDYKGAKQKLVRAYKECANKTWGDWFSYQCISAELSARYWISKPLSYWFHQESNIVPATTDMIVKFKSKESSGIDKAKQEFISKIESIKENAQVSIVKDHVYAKEKKNASYISIYAELRAPRYAAFQNTIQALEEQDIQVKKIAGNEQVQVKCLVADSNAMASQAQQLKEKKVNLLYAYGDDIHPNYRMCLFDIPVKYLQEVTNNLNRCEGVEVKFIHNF
ncbi:MULTISPECIES: hypothetical protein [unclassified Legionella]|uniref:hypothetical protein n=1 Tax=unclassified Legionella TaxID=2622702 RepID=UPI001054E74B|nr:MULTISPECIES: hypothetical protein [unclassified Legionella]MDI9819662.1 hypothetical protein [Legionella sp. PL877]